VEVGGVTNAERILTAVDERLHAEVDLTLYGRAALQLGFPAPAAEYALSHDVDGVLWVGQAEALAEQTDFWEAIEAVNGLLADQELYISHFFEETQVILTAEWRRNRVRIEGPWRHLILHRLGNIDLFLSKLMRDDPIDRADAAFIVQAGGLTQAEIRHAIRSARVPAIPEIQEQFDVCARRFLQG
jgi:hypothetical protein